MAVFPKENIKTLTSKSQVIYILKEEQMSITAAFHMFLPVSLIFFVFLLFFCFLNFICFSCFLPPSFHPTWMYASFISFFLILSSDVNSLVFMHSSLISCSSNEFEVNQAFLYNLPGLYFLLPLNSFYFYFSNLWLGRAIGKKLTDYFQLLFGLVLLLTENPTPLLSEPPSVVSLLAW